MNREEPAYKRFEGKCRTCGEKFVYYNSVKRHPDHTECPQCEAKKIVETLTGQITFAGAVKGRG